MELTSYFNDMLADIRPSEDLLDKCINAHTELRETLMNDPDLKGIVVTTFLQGSYRRSTLTRPPKGSKPDVDVVVVTNIDPHACTPAQVQERFRRVLNKYSTYRGHHKRQGRSIGLSNGPVNLDLVVTAAPSEALKVLLESDAIGSASSVESYPEWVLRQGKRSSRQDWKREPLLIPDRDANEWEQTDPISQIEWTHDKNRMTNGHYVNVVKVLKWWWSQQSSGEKGVPKGYHIERLVGLHCPDGIESVAEGVTATLESIRNTHSADVSLGRTPFVQDVGSTDTDVFKRVSPRCFQQLYRAVGTCALKARAALNSPSLESSAKGWSAIFGSVFPPPSNGSNSQTFRRPSRPAEPRDARFA